MPHKSITLLFSALAFAVMCLMLCYGFWNALTVQADTVAQMGMRLDQVTGMPSKMPGRLHSGPVFSAEGSSVPGAAQVIVILDLPSAAEVGAALRKSPAIPEALVSLAVQYEVARLRQLQQALIAQLTGPDIGATLIGQTQSASNMIFIQVDSGKLDLIRQLPDVAGVQVSKPLRQNLPKTGPIGEPPVTDGTAQDK